MEEAKKKIEGEEGKESGEKIHFLGLASSMSDIYYVGSCDYTQVEKSLANRD